MTDWIQRNASNPWIGVCESCDKHSTFLAFQPNLEPPKRICAACFESARLIGAKGATRSDGHPIGVAIGTLDWTEEALTED